MDYKTTDLLKDEIIKSLEFAENVWNKVGDEFVNERLIKAFSLNEQFIETDIPGHQLIDSNKPEVSNFIALVADLRDSTIHMSQAISAKTASASQLQRVLYETTAINTVGSIITQAHNGKITEYLGDGFLSLYKINDIKNPKELYSANNAAKGIIETGLPIINSILKDRYSLPAIELGVGMAFSKAIITIVGHGNNIKPKAIGECVYRASKLSNGRNLIEIDDNLKRLWPTSKNGILKFKKQPRKGDFDSYIINR